MEGGAPTSCRQPFAGSGRGLASASLSLQKKVVQGVVVRNGGMQNRTERNLTLAPRSQCSGKSPVAFIIIKGVITGLMESQAQIRDAQAGAPFVEASDTHPSCGPTSRLLICGNAHAVSLWVPAVRTQPSASARALLGRLRLPCFLLASSLPASFSRTSWFTAPKYRPFPTLELFSCLRGTGVARTFLFNRLMTENSVILWPSR